MAVTETNERRKCENAERFWMGRKKFENMMMEKI
jgi:hypothetical protein